MRWISRGEDDGGLDVQNGNAFNAFNISRSAFVILPPWPVRNTYISYKPDNIVPFLHLFCLIMMISSSILIMSKVFHPNPIENNPYPCNNSSRKYHQRTIIPTHRQCLVPLNHLQHHKPNLNIGREELPSVSSLLS
jgi:hypothetical protein